MDGFTELYKAGLYGDIANIVNVMYSIQSKNSMNNRTWDCYGSLRLLFTTYLYALTNFLNIL